MLKKILSVFLLFFCIVTCIAQENIKYKLQYRLRFVQDSTKIGNVSSEDFTLFIENSKSKFVSNFKLHTDSIKNKAKSDPNYGLSLLSDLSKIPRTNFSFEIYQNSNQNEYIILDKLLKDKYIYTDQIENKWTILNDTLTINGYKCQKAMQYFRGRNYEAWFTTEIPILSGPYKFRNLPGLIIKVNDTKNHYIFELISLQKDNNFAFEFPNKKNRNYIKTNRTEFIRIANNSAKNYYQKLEQSGIKLNDTGKKNFGNKLKDKIKNPIELID